MNSNQSSKGKRIRSVAMCAAVCAVSLLLLAQLLGCGKSELEKKQDSYRDDWNRIMSAFESRVESDDKKANELVEKNDVSGLIKLIKQRTIDVDSVMEEVLGLYPPKDLQDLQAITLYYLACLRDQLKAQNELNEAVVSGKPIEDLRTIAEGAALKTQQVAVELGIELQKVGIKMDWEEEQKE